MNDTLVKLSQIGIVPVVALNDINDAGPLAKALCDCLAQKLLSVQTVPRKPSGS